MARLVIAQHPLVPFMHNLQFWVSFLTQSALWDCRGHTHTDKSRQVLYYLPWHKALRTTVLVSLEISLIYDQITVSSEHSELSHNLLIYETGSFWQSNTFLCKRRSICLNWPFEGHGDSNIYQIITTGTLVRISISIPESVFYREGIFFKGGVNVESGI